MAYSVTAGLPLGLTATSSDVAVGLKIVGGAGILARVNSESASLKTVSTSSSFLALTRKEYSMFGFNPVTIFAVLVASVSQRVSVCQTILSPKVPLA